MSLWPLFLSLSIGVHAVLPPLHFAFFDHLGALSPIEFVACIDDIEQLGADVSRCSISESESVSHYAQKVPYVFVLDVGGAKPAFDWNRVLPDEEISGRVFCGSGRIFGNELFESLMGNTVADVDKTNVVGHILWIVLGVNAGMFVIETIAGFIAHSTALLADGLDMFGDASVYALTLFALSRSARWQASAALAKGGFMTVFGIGVLIEAASKVIVPVMPSAETMGVVGGLALAANLGCFVLLYRHRSDNLNMRSTWVCSRNDVIANAGVLVAAAASALLASRRPDIVVGFAIALLFLRSAFGVVVQAMKALRQPPALPLRRAPRAINIPTTN